MKTEFIANSDGPAHAWLLPAFKIEKVDVITVGCGPEPACPRLLSSPRATGAREGRQDAAGGQAVHVERRMCGQHCQEIWLGVSPRG